MSTEEDLILSSASGSLPGVRAIEVVSPSSVGSKGDKLVSASGADVSGAAAEQCLSYERYLRLSAAASVLLQLRPEIKNGGAAPSILKLGTADGALARFLPGWKLHVLCDTQTASVSDKPGPVPDVLPDQSFDVVVALGVLEGVNSVGRERLLKELARLCRYLCVVDLPSKDLVKAWPQILDLTLDAEMQRSQSIGLPDSASIGALFGGAGFHCKSFLHTSLEVWLPFASLTGLNPVAGRMLGTYLMNQVCKPETAASTLTARPVCEVDDKTIAASYAFEIIAAYRA